MCLSYAAHACSNTTLENTSSIYRHLSTRVISMQRSIFEMWHAARHNNGLPSSAGRLLYLSFFRVKLGLRGAEIVYL